MKNLLFSLGILSLVFAVACGGTSNGNPGFGGGGSTTNSKLSGSYTYQVTGYDLSQLNVATPFCESGAFVADGNGNITGGEDDFAEGSSVLHNTMSPGSYSISTDGTGVLTLKFSNGGGVQLGIDISSSPTVYLAVNVIAPNGTSLISNGTGVALQQTGSALATIPSGTFVFKMHNFSNTQGAAAQVGAFALSGGTLSSGNVDVIRNGGANSLTLTAGSFNLPDQSGRGTATLTDSQGVTSSLYYYIVDGSHLRLFSSASGNVGLGQAQTQTGTFTNASLSGNYGFGSRGDDNFSLGGVNTVGQFTASNQAITAGQFDAARDAAIVSGTFTGGNYTVASTGRAVLNLTPSTGAAIQEILWMVSPSRAYLLTNDTTKVEDGTVDLQQASSFSKSTLNGQFGFAMDGITGPPFSSSVNFFDRVGYLHWDGAGNLGLSEFVNVTGSGSTSGILNGTYTVGANGRVVGSINSLSNNLFIYMISGSQGYILQGDAGADINGMTGQLP